MTSYLPHSDEIIKLLLVFIDSVPENHHAKFGGNWTTNKGQAEGGPVPPTLMVPKDPSLNRVNSFQDT